jgi:hypothetical protein
VAARRVEVKLFLSVVTDTCVSFVLRTHIVNGGNIN